MSPHAGPATGRTPLERFADLAEQELRALNNLISMLDEERDALTQGDAEALPALIEGKAGHLHALSRYATARAHVLADAGVELDAAQIRNFLAGHAAAAETWDRLLAAARKAAGLNTANAFLTSTRLSTVSRALAVLAGPPADFYDLRGGSTRTRGPSRSLFRG